MIAGGRIGWRLRRLEIAGGQRPPLSSMTDDELGSRIAELFQEIGCPALRAEIARDHPHLLADYDVVAGRYSDGN